MANSCMRNASGDNYRNSSFIVDKAMEQIPRSTEHISSIRNITYSLSSSERILKIGLELTITECMSCWSSFWDTMHNTY